MTDIPFPCMEDRIVNYCPNCGCALSGQPAHTCQPAYPTGTRPVVVTTAHRGVFFGYATDTTGDTITLQRARLCLYWSSDLKGFMGLASQGPSATCRIGEPANITLRNITAVLEIGPEAVRRWESAPWK